MLFPFKVANKTKFEAPFGARWIYNIYIYTRVRKHEKKRNFMVHHLEDMFSKKTIY